MKEKKVTNICIISIICIFTIVIMFSVLTKTVFASSNNKEVLNNKTFISLKIEEGDTLWNIAQRYITKDYRNINEYIKEIKKTNNLSTDTIHEGGYIIVPYYCYEKTDIAS